MRACDCAFLFRDASTPCAGARDAFNGSSSDVIRDEACGFVAKCVEQSMTGTVWGQRGSGELQIFKEKYSTEKYSARKCSSPKYSTRKYSTTVCTVRTSTLTPILLSDEFGDRLSITFSKGGVY